ncbi:MAG: LLM class flavin-dependent oxidoreductase [SAR202 cluster bacterium]|jgi:alkanesulfonate monooxygenase SsuD/methylene tetrahydromethanopterin reductase-like flavin-dependent oxidoreductase (luciferase family)|nr:LLM class F420-dependent oxidoreductase [Chloroflexota bacterium]MDP6419993.1 LLM class flavin-dependent oxidoreductase [SAR202 cluster bacterium]HAL47688.1 LLM class F420-dependent oxidoreductase [Dehalococcoidia bacterium]MDP6665721.1 LLM class flavin-dependent oxidoreductase [SAR202 cluster bacterium]MQG59430.1 LLM class flavin-dependent oxidoreductase [SAR202 cluster bacterium]|tara:strand:+ start:2605 stop:3549 length:945 start_codon:yes stop_codon:yes gene_type:complete
MKFGASVAGYTTTWDDIRAAVETLEAGRWDSVWFPDHFVPPSAWKGAEDQPAHEAWMLTAAVAGMTEKLRMGHLVTGNTYRNPALVAKMAATTDQISHGRFTLGIGAAWFKREHEAYGWEYPSMRERQDRFEEACELIRALFNSDSNVDFHGKHYRLDSAPLSPGCFQTPRVPIMVGGMGERRTLRTLAKFGDIWNLDGFGVGSEANRALGGMSLELYKHKIDVINRHCEAVGRDPGEITHTVSMPTMLSNDETAVNELIQRVGPGTVAGTAEYIIERVGEFIDAGADEIMFAPRPSDAESLQALDEEVIAAFQ